MRGLSMIADGELFAVDVTLVEKVVRNVAVTPIPAAPRAVAGLANIKGGVVTMLCLAELFGRKGFKQTRSAVVFKPSTDGNDQMGILVDKPGALIDINDNEILPPPLEKKEEKSIITGIAEVGGELYRIISIDEIIDRFRDENQPALS